MASTTDLRAQEAPRTLGRYQLIKRIAIGGMAEIWVGKSTGPSGFQKVVVLKRILPSLVDRPEFVGMFLDEARIAAALSHANIVQVYDCEVEGGEYFIPMEYLHGEDVARMLRELKRRGERMPLEHALHIVTGVAAGLHYAHEKVGYDGQPMSIVHRDVTPHNVFVTYDGGVKIVDFGIAKASNRWNHTQARVLKGKIPYMSPEQCRAEVLDRRSDVFALGILLYELTTGTRLFRGRSEFEILKRIVEEPVPRPSASVPGYPPELETIVMKALCKDRGQRYQSAMEVQADVEAFARERRLPISTIGLSAYLARLFGETVEAWREAEAAGKDLAVLVLARHEVVDGSSESAAATGTLELSDAQLREDSDDDDAPVPQAADPAISSPIMGEVIAAAPPPLPVRAQKRRFAVAGIALAASVVAMVGWRMATPASRQVVAAAVVPVKVVESAQPPAVDPPAAPAPVPVPIAVQAAVIPSEYQDDPEEDETRERRRPRRHRRRDAERAAADLGELRVSSSPSCEVFVGGQSYGSTPVAGIRLSAGEHAVRCGEREATVEISTGGVTKQRF